MKTRVHRPTFSSSATSRSGCIVTFDAYLGKRVRPASAPLDHVGCATLTVRAPGFAASNLTIEEQLRLPSNDASQPVDPDVHQ